MKYRTVINEHSYGIIPVSKKGHEWHVLLVRHNASHWAFPKGHAEPSEKPLQTALRELEEETGITSIRIVPDIFFRESYSFNKVDATIIKRVNYFLGITSDRTVKLQTKELSDYRWLSIDKGIKEITFPESQRILREVKPLLNGSLDRP